MTILEVKPRHVGHAVRALPFGFSRERSTKSGMKECYQCVFGVRESVSKRPAECCLLGIFLRARLTGHSWMLKNNLDVRNHVYYISIWLKITSNVLNG